MVRVTFTEGATTASTNIGFSAKTTNSNIKVDASKYTLTVEQPGIYEFVGKAVLTSSSGALTGISVQANGTPIGADSEFLASAASQTDTIPLIGSVEIIGSQSSGYATIAFQPIGAPTIVGGEITFKRVS